MCAQVPEADGGVGGAAREHVPAQLAPREGHHGVGVALRAAKRGLEGAGLAGGRCSAAGSREQLWQREGARTGGAEGGGGALLRRAALSPLLRLRAVLLLLLLLPLAALRGHGLGGGAVLRVQRRLRALGTEHCHGLERIDHVQVPHLCGQGTVGRQPEGPALRRHARRASMYGANVPTASMFERRASAASAAPSEACGR